MSDKTRLKLAEVALHTCLFLHSRRRGHQEPHTDFFQSALVGKVVAQLAEGEQCAERRAYVKLLRAYQHRALFRGMRHAALTFYAPDLARQRHTNKREKYEIVAERQP